MNANILAIDASADACSVAVLHNGKIFTKYALVPKKHSKEILPMVNRCLIDADLNLKNIDVLAFGYGPGNFTGVRVAVSTAQGLAFGANLPVVGISSLLTVAQGAYRLLGAKRVLVTMDAKMGKIYSACYEFKSNGYWKGKKTEAILKPEQFLKKISNLTGQWVIAGTGWSIYPMLKMINLDLLESDIYFPNAQDMLFLALKSWKKEKTFQVELAQPIYFRNEVSWKKISDR